MLHKTVFIALLTLFAVSLTACGDNAGAEAKPASGLTETVSLTVENMTCATCPIAVRKALERVDGVQSAQVDFETKTATVTYDPQAATVSDLTEATTNAGYPSQRQGRHDTQ